LTLLVIAAPIVGLISFIGVAFFQGTVVQLVRDVQDGRRDSSMGQLFGSAAPAVPSILGAAVLWGLAIFVPTILVALVVAPLAILVFLALAVVLGTIWAVVVPAIVVERPGVIAAFGRSREMTRGTEVQVFAVLAVMFVVFFVVSLIFGAIGGAFGGSQIARQLVSVIGNTLTAPLLALAAATMYFELRRLKEGAAAAAPAGAPAAGPQPTTPTQPPTPPAGTPPAGAPPGTPPPSGTPPAGGSPPPAAS
jgi:hypothetical protein